MSRPWLSVVGIGADGWDGLSPGARAVVQSAELILGGGRHLAMVPAGKAERLAWSSPLEPDLERLAGWRGQAVCVLASGDPMWFGIGAILARRFPPEEMRIIPHPGAFSLAAARLGWPLQEVACLSAHGRPLSALAPRLHPGARLLILAEDGATVSALAALLDRFGYGASRLTALENLGGAEERVRSAPAAAWREARTADLATLAVELRGDACEARATSGILPDDAFAHDGQMTKREVRAATLAALGPWPGARLWDVGAGCGSISIEWMRGGGLASALEPDDSRRALIARNAEALGVPALAILAGRAPEALARMPPGPDAVFIGGGLANSGVIEQAWDALGPGGRLVANAVTAESEAILLAWHAARGGDLVRLAVSRLEPLAGHHVWRSAHPVTQYRLVKT